MNQIKNLGIVASMLTSMKEEERSIKATVVEGLKELD